MGYKEINARNFDENINRLLIDENAIFTAGVKDAFNSMTVSWGGIGIMWGKPIFTVMVRQSRHTYNFSEKYDEMTLSFFSSDRKDAVAFFGQNSGKDVDKAKETGLTPIFYPEGVSYAEADIIIVGKKVYSQLFDADGINDEKINTLYSTKDYHKFYYYEIVKILVRDV